VIFLGSNLSAVLFRIWPDQPDIEVYRHEIFPPSGWLNRRESLIFKFKFLSYSRLCLVVWWTITCFTRYPRMAQQYPSRPPIVKIRILFDVHRTPIFDRFNEHGFEWKWFWMV
jgi:hypothetical protein